MAWRLGLRGGGRHHTAIVRRCGHGVVGFRTAEYVRIWQTEGISPLLRSRPATEHFNRLGSVAARVVGRLLGLVGSGVTVPFTLH